MLLKNLIIINIKLYYLLFFPVEIGTPNKISQCTCNSTIIIHHKFTILLHEATTWEEEQVCSFLYQSSTRQALTARM